MHALVRTTFLRHALLALGGSLAIAASAQITVPLHPVPMTMQSLVVLLVGMAYGWRLGTATLLAYIVEGIAGLPVFAGFGAGPAVLAGPTGGFLLGFVPAAALAGWLAARGWTRNLAGSAAVLVLGHAVLFAAGLAWLTMLVGPDRAVAAGLLPFLSGTLVKVGLGAALVAALPGRAFRPQL
jgi:biotin transport system substrate-specific component